MAISLADKYYIKALEAYAYDMEESVDSLNYALGYDPEHVGANYLMGRMCMEYFNDFDRAEEHFITALAADPKGGMVYEEYTWLLCETRRFDEALRMIHFALTLRGVETARFLWMEARVYEMRREYQLARETLLRAMDDCFTTRLSTFLNDEIDRIDQKLRRAKGINYVTS